MTFWAPATMGGMVSDDLEAMFLRFRSEGEVDALAQVFDATAAQLHQVAMHLVGRAGDADDLVQQTFVTAIERAHTFDPSNSLTRWLAGILAKHARNAWMQMAPTTPETANLTVLSPVAEPGLVEEPSVPTDPSVPERERAAQSSVATLLKPVPRERPEGKVVITGRVVADRGHVPVSNARVTIQEAFNWPPRYEWESTTTSDGRFRFEKLNLRSWTKLHVVADNFAPTNVDFEQLMTQSPDRETDFDVGDIVLRSGEGIEGIVLDAKGDPVAGASLLLVTRSDGRTFLPRMGMPVGVSDEEGCFAIEHVPTRQYWKASRINLFAISRTGIGHAAMYVVPEIGTIHNVVLRIAPSCHVAVKVTNESGQAMAGAVVTAEPRFVPLFRVTLHEDEHGRSSGPTPNHYLHLGENPQVLRLFRATTNTDGIAVLSTLPLAEGDSFDRTVGPYDIVVRAEGYNPVFADDLRFKPEETRLLEVAVSPIRPKSIVGRVLSTSGAPIPDRRVALSRSRNGLSEKYPDAVTDEDGSFRFDGLTNETPYSVRTYMDLEHRSQSKTVAFNEGDDTEVLLAATYCGELRTEGYRDLPVGMGALFLSDAKGEWRLHRKYTRQDVRNFEKSILVPPGTGRWRFAFTEGEASAPPGEWPVIAQGGYTVDAGQRVLLPLKAPP